MFSKLFLPFVLVCCFACGTSETDSTATTNGTEASPEIDVDLPPVLAEISAAHNWQKFYEQEVIAFDAEYQSGGETRFQHTFYTRPDMSEVRMDLADGRRVYYADDAIRVVPDTSDDHDRLRFQILTWPYFLLAPFKLADPGTNWEDMGEQPYYQRPHPSGKLTFNDGVGDAPDDWYIVYQDPIRDEVAAMAYIVTYGDRPVEKAEERQRMVSYFDYRHVNDIPFATRWKFSAYDPAAAPGEMTGEVFVRNLRFVSEGVFAE